MGSTFLILSRIRSVWKSETLTAASFSSLETALSRENSSDPVFIMHGRKTKDEKIAVKWKLYNLIVLLRNNYQLTIEGSCLELLLKVEQGRNPTLVLQLFEGLNKMLVIVLNHFLLANILL